MVRAIHRQAYSICLVLSIALHGAIAFCAFESVTPVRLASFKKGKTSIALRPTQVAAGDPLPKAAIAKPQILDVARSEVLRRAAPSTAIQSAPIAARDSEIPRKAESLSRELAAPAKVETPQAAATKPAAQRRASVDPLAVVAEHAQPLWSRLDDGSPDASSRTSDYLPHPPYPSGRPIRPIRIPLSCIVGSDGRFHEVMAETGDEEWDRTLKRFIERHWRATPERRGGQAVARAKSYVLNYYQQ